MKRAVLFILIILASIFNYGKSLASKVFLLSTLVLILGLQSCSDKNETSNTNEQTITVRSTKAHNNSQVVFSSDDIKSFNETTGELMFNKNLSPAEIVENIELGFYLHDKLLFDASSFASDQMSQIINNMVLYLDISNGKFYIRDGYPSVDVLGNNKEIAIKTREENFKKIETQWTHFLKVFKDADKLIQ